MNKKIILLFVIFLVLAMFAFFKARNKPVSYNIEEEMAVESLLPKDFLFSDVNKVEIYTASKPEAKVVLGKNKEQSKWFLDTLYNAPVKQKTIEEFLENLKKLQGEFRSDSQEILADYSIADHQALVIKVYRFEKDKEQISTLLVGKKDGYNACFVRKDKSNHVYRIGKDLRSEVGLWSEDEDKTPENQHWLDKTIWKLEKEELSKISMEYPDKKLAFERVLVKDEKPVAEPEKFLDKKNEKEAEKKPGQEEKKYEWILASNAPQKNFTQSELTSLIDTLCALEASDVVDPAQKEKWGLLKPSFRLEVFSGDKKKVFLAAQPDLEKEAYGYVEENPNLVYKIENWNFNNRLFKKGSKFFTLPSLTIDKSQIKEVTLSYPQGKVVLNRIAVGEGAQEKVSWTLVSPTDKILVQAEAANEMAGKISNLKFEDYSDESNPESLGLANPYYQIKVLLKDDSTHTLKIGKNSLSMNGYYAFLEETKNTGVIEKNDLSRLFPEFDKLFKLEPVNLQIDGFTLASKEKSFSLKKQNEEWQIIVGEALHKADAQKIKDLAQSFAPLKASKLFFDTSTIQEQKPEATILLTQGEEKHAISIYPKQDSFYPVTISEGKEVYYLEEKNITPLLQDWTVYEAKTEPVKEEAKTEPVKEEAKTEPVKEEAKTD